MSLKLFIQTIPTVKLKKTAICALSTCGSEIPEGYAAAHRDGEFTHDYHAWNYVDELTAKDPPCADLDKLKFFPLPTTVRIEYVQ